MSFSGGQLLDFVFGRHFFLLSEVLVSGNQVIVRLLRWKRAAVRSSSGGNVILPVLSTRSVSNDTCIAWDYMSRLCIAQPVVSCSLKQTTAWRHDNCVKRLLDAMMIAWQRAKEQPKWFSEFLPLLSNNHFITSRLHSASFHQSFMYHV